MGTITEMCCCGATCTVTDSLPVSLIAPFRKRHAHCKPVTFRRGGWLKPVAPPATGQKPPTGPPVNQRCGSIVISLTDEELAKANHIHSPAFGEAGFDGTPGVAPHGGDREPPTP